MRGAIHGMVRFAMLQILTHSLKFQHDSLLSLVDTDPVMVACCNILNENKAIPCGNTAKTIVRLDIDSSCSLRLGLGSLILSFFPFPPISESKNRIGKSGCEVY